MKRIEHKPHHDQRGEEQERTREARRGEKSEKRINERSSEERSKGNKQQKKVRLLGEREERG